MSLDTGRPPFNASPFAALHADIDKELAGRIDQRR
jgi:hypothetical protein